jgi:fatty-acyl-CoA synthase
VANAIRELGARPGDRVAYLGVNSGSYVEVFFGACKAKTIYVGLNWRLTQRELSYILSDCGAKIIFCDAEYQSKLEDLRSELPGIQHIVTVDRESFVPWREGFSARDPNLPHSPQDAVIQFYTSGTTGKPKGVVLSNYSIGMHRWSEDQWGDWYLRSESPQVTINAMPNFHIGGLGWLLIGLFRGAKVVLMAAPDPEKFLELTEKYRVTHLFAVPVVLGMMLEAQKRKRWDLSSLKVFHYGAMPIAPKMLKEAIEVMGCGFVQYYGMTETGGTVVVLKPEDHDPNNPERLKSCGRAAAGMEIKICDSNGRELPPNSPGEIWVKTPAMMQGYWNLPEATAEVVHGDWYQSGDGGRMDANGYIYMADRIKDMIVSGGENIYPSEVENALYEHEAVAEVAVVGIPDEKWGEAVKGLIVLAKGKTVSEEELISFLRPRIAGYKIPRIYSFVDALPRTPSGKVKKFELRKVAEAQLRQDAT